MKTFHFFWSIENISYAWHQPGRPIVSPEFCCKPFGFTLWTLELYPRGVDNSDFFSLNLCRSEDGGPDNLSLNIKFSCMSTDRSELHSVFIPQTFTNFKNNGFSTYGEECFIQRYEVLGRKRALYVPRDTLELRCQMWLADLNAPEFDECYGFTRLMVQRIPRRDVHIDFENALEKSFPIQSVRRNNKTLMVFSFIPHGEVMDVGIIPVTEELMKYSTCKMSIVNEKTGRKIFDCTRHFFGCPKKTEWRFPFVDKMPPAEKEISEKYHYEISVELAYSTGEDQKAIEQNRPIRAPEFFSNYVVRYTPYGQLQDLSNVSDDLWKMYTEQVLCDVELKSRNKSLFAHQFVLCARSTVFSIMLSGEMKEKMERCIEIEDITPESLGEFLKFLYTNSFTFFTWKTLMELYYAADKYSIERLKLLCCSHFLKNINVKNVFELLFLADRHQDSELRRRVDQFIWENDETIFTSSRWKHLTIEQPKLVIQTMLSKYNEKVNQNPPGTYENRISFGLDIHDEFKSFYESQMFCDIVIKTAGTKFPAHKTVLCASSSTFKEIFTKDLKDEPTDLFEMTDFDDNTVSQMLLFLYTDSLEDLQWHTAMKLYDLANVYKIQRLKIHISCFFLKNLRVPIASNLLLFAHERSDNALRAAVEDYILLYHEEVFGSDEWAKVVETNSVLALEIMQAKFRKNKTCL
ncbi:Speckle-type POZ protein B like protein [Argiope bruennichi]|uniref:Speckle-type POZ protein B like protein n=1 Tax=Argiope bruennichi TaxID=94029 RepID=A0A8T0ER38_ARGBR|nr:Speckle-type POZ protein B like protein [Argiope bruennichi]